MDSLRAFGVHLRRKRQERGFPSARAFALHARLSDSHVGKFERGEYRPRWKTAQRLIKALRLTTQERDEFTRLWATAGTPRAAQAAAGGLPIPGLSMWKHLPGLLFQTVQHGEPELWTYDPDAVLNDVVRGAASLLTWASLRQTGPDESESDQLRRLAETAFRRSLEHAKILAGAGWSEQDAAADAMSILPSVRRAQVFSSARSTRALVGLIDWWQYDGGLLPEDLFAEPTLTIMFKPSTSDRLSLSVIPVDLVVDAHEALIAHRLWRDLGLADRLPLAGLCRQARRLNLSESIAFLFEREPADFVPLAPTPPRSRAAPRTVGGEIAALLDGMTAFNHYCRAGFALRLWEVPELAAELFTRSYEDVVRCFAARRAPATVIPGRLREFRSRGPRAGPLPSTPSPP